MAELSCVVHVHSRYSDGTATVAEILCAARDSGAQAVLLTDHDTLGAKRDGLEGWHDGVFLLVGHEVSSRAGHYLAFGLDEEIAHEGLDAAGIARAVADAGGFGFAAHPFSRGSRMVPRIAPAHGWPALADPACTGIELWSVVTDVAESWRTPSEALRFLRDPEPVLDAGPPQEHLSAWDRIASVRRMPAIGGLDAHQTGLRVNGWVLSPLSHRRCFGWLRTHLVFDAPLHGEVDHDRAVILHALRNGRAFVHRPGVWPATGARFWLRLGDGTVPMGAEVLTSTALACVDLPRAADLRLVRDGVPVVELRGVSQSVVRIGEPGAYRIEAHVQDRLWLLSNPIYMR